MYEVWAAFNLRFYVECLPLCQFSCYSGLLNKSVKNSCAKFHENPVNVPVANGMSQPCALSWSHKVFILFNKECL